MFFVGARLEEEDDDDDDDDNDNMLTIPSKVPYVGEYVSLLC